MMVDALCVYVLFIGQLLARVPATIQANQLATHAHTHTHHDSLQQLHTS